MDDAKVARQLWAFVDEVGDGAAVLNDAIDVRRIGGALRRSASNGETRRSSGRVGAARDGEAARRRRCEDACST